VITVKKAWVVAAFVILGGLLTWATFTGSQNAALSARVTHLTAVLRATPSLDLDALEAKLASVTAPGGVDEARLMSIVSRITDLEKALTYPIVSATEAGSLVGKYIAVYGKATARVSGAHMFLNFEESTFSAPFFNFKDAISPEQINNASGVVVRGTVGQYQGAPQIIINNIDQLYLP